MSALHGGERSASRPGRFIRGSHWIEGWVGTRARLDVSESRKFVAHDNNRIISLVRPLRKVVTTLTGLSRKQRDKKHELSTENPFCDGLCST